MPLMREPEVTLEDIRLRKISLTSLDFMVKIRVTNPNALGITIREIPFFVACSTGGESQEVARGNTGRATIPARDSTLLSVPVTSQNSALIGALAAFLSEGGVTVTIRGTAVIDALLFGWSVPFEKTLPVTLEQVAESIAKSS